MPETSLETERGTVHSIRVADKLGPEPEQLATTAHGPAVV